MQDNPSITIKRKNINVVFEYCLDNKVEFTVKPGRTAEESTIEFTMENITRAIAFGMFLRENRIQLNGLEPALNAAATKGGKKQAEAKEKQQAAPTAEETLAGLGFEENNMELNLIN